ncbi:MAG: phenylacetate--CoA ligase family protein [Myxococcales bacterium]|nr:phenylacetate--CoA ligase family protein [Myxococcales bacterium]
MSVLAPPRLLDDPGFERRALGPFLARARALLRRQLRTGLARVDLESALGHAYLNSPYYQRVFARAAIGRGDLERPTRALAALPVTRRADLQRDFVSFLAAGQPSWALDRGWLGRSSGSTGTPVPYLREPRTLAWFYAFLDFALAYAGLPGARGDVVLLDALGHLPDYEARLPSFHGARFTKLAIGRADRLRALAPLVVTSDPDGLAPLAELDLPRPPRLVLSSAFALDPGLRAAIAERTGAVVLEYYSTQETSVLAVGCRLGHGYHPLAGAAHLELDAGEVVVTTTNNLAFPLIRYAPGDRAEMADDRCPCGLRGPRLTRLLGRTHETFVGARGPFAANVLGPLLARLPVDEVELAQVSASSLVLRYRAASELSTECVAALRTRLEELAGPVSLTRVRVEAPLRRPGEKPRPFVPLGAAS